MDAQDNNNLMSESITDSGFAPLQDDDVVDRESDIDVHDDDIPRVDDADIPYNASGDEEEGYDPKILDNEDVEDDLGESIPQDLVISKSSRSPFSILKNLLARYRLWFVVIILIILCTAIIVLAIIWVKHTSDDKHEYKISFTVEALNNQVPILNNTRSEWRYNYNCAYLPVWKNGTRYDGLAVRVQNNSVPYKTFYDVGPSQIVLTLSEDGINFGDLYEKNLMIASTDHWFENHGAEDPRIVYDEKTHTYYMFYSAVTNHTDGHGRPSVLGNITSYLALAVAYENNGDLVWDQRGPMFPELGWSKSGAFLLREGTHDKPHLLFWGDNDIHIAYTTNMTTWINQEKPLMTKRANYFDSELIESGPEPLPLSDGNFLFLYNSGCLTDEITPDPNWHLKYHIGYVVLDKNDPTYIIKRSASPLISPEFPWQKCGFAKGDPVGLKPNVVFVEGWRKTENENEFLVYIQGCDSYIGVFKIQVHL